MDTKSALNRAIKIAGSQTALAAAIGGKVKTGHIYYWLETGNVPPGYCPSIERATGVRCEDLNPDVEWVVVREARKAA